jgi:hypothetical protein
MYSFNMASTFRTDDTTVGGSSLISPFTIELKPFIPSNLLQTDSKYRHRAGVDKTYYFLKQTRGAPGTEMMHSYNAFVCHCQLYMELAYNIL